MKETTKSAIGVLTMVLIGSLIVYVSLANQVRIRVDADKSTFYVYDNGWMVSGREYNKFFDGSTRLYRDSNSIEIDSYFSENQGFMVIERKTKYKRGFEVTDIYLFNGTEKSVELFPIEHYVNVVNASGYLFRYEVRDLKYNGETFYYADSPVAFGNNMKISFQSGYRWAHIYKSGIFKAQYKIESDSETFRVRLYDPEDNSSFNQPIQSDSTRHKPEPPKKEATYKGKKRDLSKLNVGVRHYEDYVVIDDVFDGNGDGICQKGESCCIITNGAFTCTGRNADDLKYRLKFRGIK